MADASFNLTQDTKGVVWDLLLYVPTVTVLLSMAAKFWFGGDTTLAYLLVFLGSFFLIAGANRILKTRLMLLPSAPIAMTVEKTAVHLALRSGETVDLVKNLRFYSDYAGRSFGLSGQNGSGKQLQFVFHKGQFSDPQDYQLITDKLRNR